PGTKHAQITASSFTQNAGGTTLFRGTNLGVNNAADKVAASANIIFTAAPTLSGSGDAGTSTVGIIAGAYGDTTTGGTGAGLVTYDSVQGVRLLSSSEYTETLAILGLVGEVDEGQPVAGKVAEAEVGDVPLGGGRQRPARSE